MLDQIFLKNNLILKINTSMMIWMDSLDDGSRTALKAKEGQWKVL